MASGQAGPFDPRDGAEGESIGAVLSRLRLLRGKSQLRVAELLCAASGVPTVTRHEVSRWEREERIPSAQWLRWLAVVLDAPLDELERATALARARRITTSTMRVPESLPWSARSRPFGVADLRRMDDLVGGPELAELVHRELRRAMAALHEFTGGRGVAAPSAGQLWPSAPDPLTLRTAAASRAGQARLRWVAELAQLAAWVAADAGAPISTLDPHRIGLRAAAAAGDEPLAGHLVGGVAQLTAEAGDARSALRLARAAVHRSGPASSAGARALQWQRVAYAAALAGERQAAEEALVVAERAFERRDPARDPDWLAWYDEPNFTGMAGRCFAALGRTRLARPLLGAALTARDRGRRQLGLRAWAICGTALAGAHVDAGDLDAACATAGEALLMCVRAGSVRATRQIRAAEPRLRAATGDAALRSYDELAASSADYLPGATPTWPPDPAFAAGDD